MKRSYPNLRARRRTRIKTRGQGTTAKPRFSVFRSSRHIYAQLIDDVQGRTLVAACDLEKKFSSESARKSKVEIARLVGEQLGTKAKEKKISQAIFDRSGYRYHGRVKALAEGARAAGVKI